jgi:hypothetical protein
MDIVAEDGLIRLTLRQMRALPLVHLLSGLDEFEPNVPRCGSRTTITGYTEWLGGPSLDVTMGWDWRFEMAGPVPLWRRSGSPRSNVQLVDSYGRDMEWDRNLILLGSVVDALSWAEQARSAISQRYAA